MFGVSSSKKYGKTENMCFGQSMTKMILLLTLKKKRKKNPENE